MMKWLIIVLSALALLSGCIGNDILEDTVEEAVKITTRVDTLGLNDSFQFEARYTDPVGLVRDVALSWRSADTSVLSIELAGLAKGVALGETQLYVELNESGLPFLQDSVRVVVGSNTSAPPVEVRSGTIKTTSSYLLEGAFTVTVDGNDLLLNIADDYQASTSLPGLYLYLANNPNTTSNALEIGAVKVFDGAHQYRISGVGISDYEYLLYYCKPFNVKVGDGKME